jgi:four helix bundle protein
MRRAAVSIPSNIAEGHTREHSREYLHHISIAQASLAELETHLEIALRLGFLQPDHAAPIVETFASLGRQLFALRNSLNRRIVSEDSADLYMLTDFESGQPDPIVQENGGHEATSIQ